MSEIPILTLAICLQQHCVTAEAPRAKAETANYISTNDHLERAGSYLLSWSTSNLTIDTGRFAHQGVGGDREIGRWGESFKVCFLIDKASNVYVD